MSAADMSSVRLVRAATAGLLGGCLAAAVLWQPTGAVWSSITSDTGNSFAAAADVRAPSGTVSAGNVAGRVTGGNSYYVYGNLSDTGSPASGMSTVTADASAVTAGQTAASMTTAGGPFSFGGSSYNYRSSALSAGSSLASCRASYTVTGADVAGNSASTAGSVMVDRDLAVEYHLRINGPTSGGTFQQSVAPAGDVNNDGRPDVIIGRENDDYSGRTDNGSAYVIFGTATQTTIDLAALGAGQGFRMIGSKTNDWAGMAVASAGDINGDGFDDVAVGAPGDDNGATAYTGAVYIVWGKASGTAVDFASLGTSGYRIVGGAGNDYVGRSIANIGRLLGGDSIDDLIIGAPSISGAGKVYVLRGENRSSQLDLTSFNSGAGVGFAINGAAAGDNAGTTVASPGDVNGDGVPDVLLGAPGADPSGRSAAGAGYVIFGKTTTGSVSLSSIGTAGFQMSGAIASATAGLGTAAAGDVNGDGKADVAVAAPSDTASGRTTAGVTYVVFGRSATSTIDLAALGTAGYRILGAATTDKSGYSIAGLGDVNSDSVPDLLVGAPFADPLSRATAGAAYVVFGQSGSTADIDLLSLGVGGYVLQGAVAGDELGFAVGNAGDVTGDGRTDVLLTATTADPSGRTDTGQQVLSALPSC